MHIRLDIPPKRGNQEGQWRLPSLGKATQSYLVPLNTLYLKESVLEYSTNDYDVGEKQNIRVEHKLTQYWVLEMSILGEWHEIHCDEYERIQTALKKMNLLEANGHNKEARILGMSDKILTKTDMNALFRLEVL